MRTVTWYADSQRNTLASKNGHSPLSVRGSLTLRGNGALPLDSSVNSQEAFISVLGDMTVTGNVSINVKAQFSTNAIYVGGTLSMASAGTGSTVSPTLRIEAAKTGISANKVVTYAGELSVKAKIALSSSNVRNFGGTMELLADQAVLEFPSQISSSLWIASYVDGFVIWYRQDSIDTLTANSGYGNSQSVGLAKNLFSTFTSEVVPFPATQALNTYKYVRISPRGSSNEDGIVLSVKYGENTYSKNLSKIARDNINICLYLPESGSELSVSPYDTPTTQALLQDKVIVAKGMLAQGEYSWTLQSYKPGNMTLTEDTTNLYDYTLSGAISISSGSRGGIDASNAGSLTLENLTYTKLVAPADGVLTIKGDNYLIEQIGLPLKLQDGKVLDLRSDGSGTLTLAIGIQNGSGAALYAAGIALHNVKSLTVMGNSRSPALSSTGPAFGIDCYDGLGQNAIALPYGLGWKLDVGVGAAGSETPSQPAIAEYANYVRIYSTTSDALSDPDKYVFDQADPDSAVYTHQSAVIVPIRSGKVHQFDSGDASCKASIIAEGPAGNIETVLTYGTDYTWTADGIGGTFGLTDSALSRERITAGSYTLRIYFMDENVNDGITYTLDIPVTVIDTAAGIGELKMRPNAISMSIGDSYTFNTTFTGTTPAAYKWQLGASSNGLTLTSYGASASVEIGSGAEIGASFELTATSYLDAECTIPLGTVTATVTVVPKATGIEVSCEGETPSGDGSYMIYHTVGNDVNTWQFDAVVTLDDGTQSDAVTWSLWGAQMAKTNVSADGLLTISVNERGTGGLLKLIATYKNANGSTLVKETIIYLSTDARVSYGEDDTANGHIVNAYYGVSQTEVEAGGTWVPMGNRVVFRAESAENYKVMWFVNGVEASGNSAYTVSADGNTLSFTTVGMAKYSVTTKYVSTDRFTITCTSGKNGSVEAVSGGVNLPKVSTVAVGSTVVVTAKPAANYRILRWMIDGREVQVTGDSYTFSNIDADHKISVEFIGREISVTFLAAPTGTGAPKGTLSLLVNGVKTEVTGVAENDHSVSYTATVHAYDDITVLAVPESGYIVAGWAVKADGLYSDIAGSADLATYTVNDITESFDIKVEFAPVPTFNVIVSTNSYQNGSGSVCGAGTVVAMASSHTFTVSRSDNLTLLAVPDSGCYLYDWSVEGAQYVKDGNSLTLTDINGSVTVRATFRRNFYNVAVTAEGDGTLDAGWSINILGQVFSGSVSTGSEVKTGSFRGGSSLTFKGIPSTDTDNVLSQLVVNGRTLTPVWSEADGAFVCTIDNVTGNVTAKAIFTRIDAFFDVKTATEKTRPGANEGETVTAGRILLGILPDGVSKVGAEDTVNKTKTARVAAGGSATIAFEPETGYILNTAALFTQIREALSAAESEASFRVELTAAGCIVTVRGIDKALDFTGVDPFEAEPDEPVAVYTVLLAASAGGKLTASCTLGELGTVSIANGAKLPAGTVVTLGTQADEHYVLGSLTKTDDDATDMPITGNTFTVGSNTVVQAAFEVGEYKVSVSVSGSGDGAVLLNDSQQQGEQYMPAGSELKVVAAAETTSRLSILRVVGGSSVAGKEDTYLLDGDTAIAAVFEVKQCAVTFAQPANGRLLVYNGNTQITSGTVVDVGTALTVIPIADKHYALSTLTAGGTALALNTVYTVNANKENVIACSFAVSEIAVRWTAVNGSVNVTIIGGEDSGAAVTNGQYVPVNSQIKIRTAPSSANYKLDTLSVTGASQISSGSEVYQTAGADVAIAANFKYVGDIPDPDPIPVPVPDSVYSVEFIVQGEGVLSVTDTSGIPISSGERVLIGTNLIITAAPADELTSLTVNGIEFSNGTKYEVYANTTVIAVFGEKKGIPYYLDDDGNRIFIGFSYDLDGSLTWQDGEYIALEGKKVSFAENPKTFTDVDGHWAEAYISFVTERELFLGVGSNKFGPNVTMNRSMFATVIGRLYERSYGQIVSTGTNRFTDCDYSQYYGRYVDWAAENGIIKGYGNGKYGPLDPITREQMAQILYAFATFLGAVPDDMEKAMTFGDSADVSNWAVNAVLFCQSTGLIKGVGDNTFLPRNTATRADVSTIINRFITYILSRDF